MPLTVSAKRTPSQLRSMYCTPLHGRDQKGKGSAIQWVIKHRVMDMSRSCTLKSLPPPWTDPCSQCAPQTGKLTRNNICQWTPFNAFPARWWILSWLWKICTNGNPAEDREWLLHWAGRLRDGRNHVFHEVQVNGSAVLSQRFLMHS